MIDPQELHNLLRYAPATGRLFWRSRGNPKFDNLFAGREAFTADHNQGYKTGRIKRKNYLAHRVIWAMHHGEWPDGEIDHIDGDRSSNVIGNLRVVDRTENCRNAALRCDNTSGRVGIDYVKSLGKYRARIADCHLGVFDQVEEAIAARRDAEIERGFHPNHGRSS